MSFAPTARIDLDALRHNLAVARAAAPGRQVMAVVKADAYGHGLLPVAAALAAADALAVARLDEAVTLREAGHGGPLVLLEGCFDAEEMAQAAALDLTLVVHHPDQIALLRSARPARPLACWLKVDTGMHRLGLAPERAADAFEQLAGLAAVRGRPGLMTHLANADDRNDLTTGEQLARLAPLANRFEVPLSMANSAGVLGWPGSHGDWIRPGLMLYGITPFNAGAAQDLDLRPVMTLGAVLLARNHLRAGDPVGYGGSWRCPEAMPVGVVGIGYGDGYPREIGPDTPVLVNGQPSSVIGRVSMDMITIDLRGLPDARVGDPVTLWGQGLPVERIARAADTIPYTLCCGVTARVRHQYLGGRVAADEARP